MLQERFANVRPVIVRELRAQARSPAYLRVRLLAAGLAIGALGLMATSAGLLRAGNGDEAFVPLHLGMVFLLCLLGPALTADAISRERREGTLPLLWLCSLRPDDVLLGKLAAHGLVLLTAWLAAAPVLLVPLLLGGVSAGLILSLLAIEAGVGGVCLSSGLLASTWSKRAERSLLSAYFIAGCMLAMGFFLYILLVAVFVLGKAPWLENLPDWIFGAVMVVVILGGAACLMALQLRAARDALLIYWHRPISLEDITGPVPVPPPPVRVAIPAPVDAPRPPPVLSTEDPLALWLRKRQRRLAQRWLEREPARVLALRQPAEAMLLPVLAAGGVAGFWLLSAMGGAQGAAPFFGLLSRWAGALTAAWAFRSLVWSSLMEPLLATVQPARSLLRAHVWAHQRLFGPTLLVLAAGTACEAAATDEPWRLTWLAGPAAMYWAAPRIGAWASLRFRSFIVAMLVTVSLGLTLPAIAGQGALAWIMTVLAQLEHPGLAGMLRSIPVIVGVAVLLVTGALAGRAAAGRLESRQGFAHLLTE
ncbi:MAG: ABC transporter permease [Limisphaerales bacterium]